MARKKIVQWRISQAEPSGLTLWFDPMTEFPRLFELEPHLRSGVETLVGDDANGANELREVSKYQQLSLLEGELPPDGAVE